MDRIATFKSFIARTPADPFPRYGLAMEHKGRGELDQAWVCFSELLEKFPDYVATYLMAGGTLAALGRLDEAADIYRRGVAAAGRKGDAHAKGELETALAELPAAPNSQGESPRGLGTGEGEFATRSISGGGVAVKPEQRIR